MPWTAEFQLDPEQSDVGTATLVFTDAAEFVEPFVLIKHQRLATDDIADLKRWAGEQLGHERYRRQNLPKLMQALTGAFADAEEVVSPLPEPVIIPKGGK